MLNETRKYRNYFNKTQKNNNIRIDGGSLEAFEEKIDNLILHLEKKLKKLNKTKSNRTSLKKDYDDNICHKFYLDDCIEFQSLIANNIEHLSQISISSKINSIFDEKLRYSLLYIYYSSINDDEIYKLYGSHSEVKNVTSVSKSKEKTPPIPKQITPPKSKEKTPPIPKQITPSSPDIFSFKHDPLNDEELNNPNKLILMNFWIKLINKIEKEKHNKKQAKYRKEIPKTPYSAVQKTALYLEEFKDELTEMFNKGNVCNEIMNFSSYYSTKTFLSDENSNKLCVVFLVIGYLSRILYYSKTCILLIKGGKALQFHSPNMPSDDIDITIMPYHVGPEKKSLSESEIDLIGKMVTQFILWATTWNKKSVSSNKIFSAKFRELDTSYLPKGDEYKLIKKEMESAKIIKLSIDTGAGYFAISDIGLGYNSMPKFVKGLLSSFEIRESDKYMFCYPSKEVIVKEKAYYILKYLYECNGPNAYFRDKAFYTLHEFLINIKDSKKTQNKFLEDCLSSLDINIEKKHSNNVLSAITQGIFISKWFIYNEYTQQYTGPYPSSYVFCLPKDVMIFNQETQILVKVGNYFKSLPIISEKYKLKERFLE